MYPSQYIDEMGGEPRMRYLFFSDYSYTCLQDLFYRFKILLVGLSHCHRHKGRKDRHKAPGISAISQLHPGRDLAPILPFIGCLHRERSLSGPHNNAHVFAVFDNLICIARRSVSSDTWLRSGGRRRVSNQSDPTKPSSLLHRARNIPFPPI